MNIFHASVAISQLKCLDYAIFVAKMTKNGIYALWWAGLAQRWAGQTILGPGLAVCGNTGLKHTLVHKNDSQPQVEFYQVDCDDFLSGDSDDDLHLQAPQMW